MSKSRKIDTIPPETAFTPRELVGELDRFIVGRTRRRRRRDRPPRSLAAPAGARAAARRHHAAQHHPHRPDRRRKTEIARRLAKLVKAPFVKVEASKFTEVGYVGRDVEASSATSPRSA